MFARILTVTLATAAIAIATSADTTKSPRANERHAARHDTTMKAMGDSTHAHAMMHDSTHAAPQDTLKTVHTCPMHPRVMQSAPGRCPVCGMNLVPRKTAAADSVGHQRSGHGAHTHDGHTR